MTLICPNCTKSAELYFTVPDLNQTMSNDKFDYYRCNSCKLIFMHPVPLNLQSYYGAQYGPYQRLDATQLSNSALGDLNKLEITKRYASGMRLLEIGPGGGTFAYLAKQAGFKVDAIEMDSACCKFLEDEIKINRVFNSTEIASTLGEMRDSYEVVAMWQVLEHLVDPWKVLEKIAHRLSSGGVLILATPNPDSLHFALFKQYWMHVDAPRHVVLIPHKTLEKRVSEYGLEMINITTKGDVNSQHSQFENWRRSLDNAQRGASETRLKRMLIAVGGRKVVYDFTGWFEKIEGIGSSYVAVFRKQ